MGRSTGKTIIAIGAFAIVVVLLFALAPSGMLGSSSSTTSTSSTSSSTTSSETSTTTTSTSTTTTASSDGETCTKTEVTDVNGDKKENNFCSPLWFIGLSTTIDGQQIYDSATGKSGQITKKVVFTHAPSKPVNSTNLQVGIDAFIGTTKIASNNTLIHLDGSPSSLQAISLTLTGLKLESYSYLFQNGGTLRFVIKGNETFAFTDSSILTQSFTGTAGNASLSYKAGDTTLTNSDECGGCPLNNGGSAYTIPDGSGTLTIAIVCNTDARSICPSPTAWIPAAGGSISASQLCWNEAKLTQACSISPSSFSGTLDSNSQYSFQITSVTVGSFSGFYLSGGTVVCCAPQYAPVGYIGSIVFVSPYYGRPSLAIQFVVAESPTTSKVGGTVYIIPPCDWFASTRACSA